MNEYQYQAYDSQLGWHVVARFESLESAYIIFRATESEYPEAKLVRTSDGRIVEERE